MTQKKSAVVVVESPAKCKTIKKYLGAGYRILASYGHVRDLIPKSGAVDTDGSFAMHYEPIDRNKKHVDAIAKAVKQSDILYLATDPDREGEEAGHAGQCGRLPAGGHPAARAARR